MTTDEALELATKLHDGQTDRIGAPYVEHVQRVGDAMRDAGYPQHVVIAAYLHDAVEDTHATLSELAALGVPADSVQLVELLTRKPGQDYADYLNGVKIDSCCMAIKIADITDNLSPARTSMLPASDRARLAAKYQAALSSLGVA